MKKILLVILISILSLSEAYSLDQKIIIDSDVLGNMNIGAVSSNFTIDDNSTIISPTHITFDLNSNILTAFTVHYADVK